MENDKIFAKGIYFDKPREGAPEFVKGRISFKVDEAIEFLTANKKEDGYVNLDLKKSKGGKLYLELNTWKPTPKNDLPDPVDYPEEPINLEDVPF